MKGKENKWKRETEQSDESWKGCCSLKESWPSMVDQAPLKNKVCMCAADTRKKTLTLEALGFLLLLW